MNAISIYDWPRQRQDGLSLEAVFLATREWRQPLVCLIRTFRIGL